MKKLLPVAIALALGVQANAQTYAPISLTGFNTDIIANGFGPALSSTTGDVDGGGYTFVAQNYVSPSNQTPATSLPLSGTISSATTAGLNFQLAPYSGNNSLRLTTANNSGTLTFAWPRTADQVYVLATTAYPSTFTATVTYADATTEVFAGNAVTNWFDGTSPLAIKGISRVQRSNDGIQNSTTNPRLYQFALNISAANITKPIQSIAFTKTSTAANEILHIMGVSIRSVASTLPNDVGVSAITTPNSGCSLTSQETITVAVSNFGASAQSNIPVSYTLNNGTAVNEVLPGPLAPNATINYTFAAKANLSAVGSYNLAVTTGLTSDAQAVNNAVSKTIAVASAPASPTVAASGATTFCPGNYVTLTATTPVAGATFQWFKDGAAVAGATSAAYSANVAGSYTVVVNKDGCSSPASTAVALNTSAAPATPQLNASGPLTLCTGGSVTLTASSSTSGATFSWLKNGSTIPGVTGATYTATSAGAYSVMAISGGCNSSASGAANVTVKTTPAKPTITSNGAVLTSSSGVGNQWFLNGTAIGGANGQHYTATATGAYTVAVTNNTCTSAQSNAVNLTIAGTKEEVATKGISIFPNPTHGKFTVNLNGAAKNGTLTLYSLTGQQIATYAVPADGAALQVSIPNLAAGTYLVKVTSEELVKVERLIVQ